MPNPANPDNQKALAPERTQITPVTRAPHTGTAGNERRYGESVRVPSHQSTGAGQYLFGDPALRHSTSPSRSVILPRRRQSAQCCMPIWRHPGRLVFHAHAAPNMMSCRGGESPRAIKMPAPMAAAGPRCGLARPPAGQHGQQAAWLAALPDRDGEHPARRAAAVFSAPGRNSSRRRRLREPAVRLPAGAVQVPVACLRCPRRYAPPERAARIRAHRTGGTPLNVIWGIPRRSGLPTPVLREQAGSQQVGGCHARRQRPFG